MKILIIEDEKPAADKLARYLLKYDTNIIIHETIASVAKASEWIEKNHGNVDVIFMDIQLVDGLSFEIFERTEVKCPVIFITAYDDYALDAFKVNSIDYILKPVTYIEISRALKKLKTLSQQLINFSMMKELVIKTKSRSYKDRFMVKKGNHIHSIKTSDIQLFYAEGRTVYLVTMTNERFIIDYILSEIEGVTNSDTFYRVNRSFIININAIKNITKYSNSRLKLLTSFKVPTEIVVSREKVSEFKQWLEGSE